MDTTNFNSNPKQVTYPEPTSGNYQQETPNLSGTKPLKRYYTIIKALVISILILLLMIPMVLIGNLINERERTAEEATIEVHQKWSGSQTILGPVLTIPYYEISTGEDDKKEKTKNILHVFPETLDIKSDIETKELNRGLYEIVVYNAPIEFRGTFVLPEELNNLPEETLNEFFLNEAMLNIGISDLRGISEQIEMKWGNQTLVFNPGIQHNLILSSGVSTNADINNLFNNRIVEFSIKLELKGSETLRFAPLGKTTTVTMSSNCSTPSFSGAFLPTNREINENGFKSDWKVMHLNRNYPQVISGNRWQRDIEDSIFGVDMLLPVQHYQKSMRSVKYAILIIALTFVVSFFVEILQKKPIHPFQYLLVGLALCLFYSLLISISEHTSFTNAYAIAAVMTVTLLTCYMAGVLKIKKTAFTIGALLAILYLYIFVLIQMETYALLAGSIGLFIILAVIMYFSQRINWNGQGQE